MTAPNASTALGPLGVPPRPRRRRGGRPVWEESPTPLGQLGKGTVLTVLVLAVLFPMWCVVVTSLASRQTIDEAGGMVVVPRELDLSAYQGYHPVEMFGRSRFPRVGELPYLLTLAPRGFYWFQLVKDEPND